MSRTEKHSSGSSPRVHENQRAAKLLADELLPAEWAKRRARESEAQYIRRLARSLIRRRDGSLVTAAGEEQKPGSELARPAIAPHSDKRMRTPRRKWKHELDRDRSMRAYEQNPRALREQP
jgi:hypothetical protein